MTRTFQLIRAYLRANLRAALEYRASFASEVFAMLLNDVMWLAFWIAFYDRFPAVHGWQRAQVVSLWALVATSFGLATAVFGNLLRLAGIVARGELDFFLALPRPVLLHVLISRMSFTAWGDVLFGVFAFAAFASPAATDWLWFAWLCVANAAILSGFGVCMGSLAFWLRDAEGPALYGLNALIMFSTQPLPAFRGAVQLVLLSVVPAGFLGYVPVEILRSHAPHWLCAHAAVALGFALLGARVFAHGAKRYESGNLFLVRSIT